MSPIWLIHPIHAIWPISIIIARSPSIFSHSYNLYISPNPYLQSHSWSTSSTKHQYLPTAPSHPHQSSAAPPAGSASPHNSALRCVCSACGWSSCDRLGCVGPGRWGWGWGGIGGGCGEGGVRGGNLASVGWFINICGVMGGIKNRPVSFWTCLWARCCRARSCWPGSGSCPSPRRTVCAGHPSEPSWSISAATPLLYFYSCGTSPSPTTSANIYFCPGIFLGSSRSACTLAARLVFKVGIRACIATFLLGRLLRKYYITGWG